MNKEIQKLFKKHRLSTKIVWDHYDDDTICILLLQSWRGTKDEIGFIQLCKMRKHWVTNSAYGIPRRFRGKGIGLYLYTRLIKYALEYGLSVRSDDNKNRKPAATAIWKKLYKTLDIKKHHGYYEVKGVKCLR